MAISSLLPSALQGWNVPLLLLLVKATLILVAALGITLAMRRASAGARHLVWLVTLGALVLMPALTAWAPIRLELLPAEQSASAATPPATGAPTASRPTLTLDGTSMTMVAPSPWPAPAPAPAAAKLDAGPAAADASLWQSVRDLNLVSIALGIWALVALAIIASLLWSARTVRRLVRDGRELDDASWLHPLYEVSDRLGLENPPRLLQSEAAKMPFACGLLRPTIVLPAECESWTADRRLAVLLHELAHVRRRDLAGHTLGRLVCAVYWFHPLVWTAARRLRSESERACDDLALACGTRATDYAEHLLDIVTSVRREGTPMVALAMARRNEFEGRMLAILDPEIPRGAPSRRQSAVLIGALALISVTVGASAPVPRTAAAASVAAPAWVADTLLTSDLDRTTEETRPDAPTRAVIRAEQPAPQASSERTSGKTGEQVVERQVEHAITQTVKQSLSGASGLSVSALLGGRATATTQQARDERATLLARVLRTDTSASLRRVAAWGLEEHAETNEAMEALASAVRRDAEPRVREMAAWSLSNGNSSSVALDALHAALRSDASVSVRATAAWALGELEDESSMPALTAALGDASPDVRTRAIWAIGNVEPKQAPRPLLALLTDANPRVRHLTAWALYRIEDPESAPALEAALRSEADKDLQIAYIRALSSLGERSVSALKGLLESPDARVRSMAVHALAGGNASGPWPHPWPQPRPSP